jgi:hypothetical protein
MILRLLALALTVFFTSLALADKTEGDVEYGRPERELRSQITFNALIKFFQPVKLFHTLRGVISQTNASLNASLELRANNRKQAFTTTVAVPNCSPFGNI